MFVIQAQNIAITRHQQQLFYIEQLVINPGDRIGLVGANGAGKTTLIDILTGALTPDAGMVDRQTTPVVVHQLHDISTQSGGEQVKNAILTALRQQPEWLILDEPSANLDETNQQWLIDQLNRFKGTLLLISHDRTLLNAVTTLGRWLIIPSRRLPAIMMPLRLMRQHNAIIKRPHSEITSSRSISWKSPLSNALNGPPKPQSLTPTITVVTSSRI